jgi:2-haloacid dehalogenase
MDWSGSADTPAQATGGRQEPDAERHTARYRGGMPSRLAAVAFDVIETMMPLEPLRERFTARGMPPHLLELWFTRTLRDGIALAAAGDYAPFGEVAEQALRVVSGFRATDADIAYVLAGLLELPVHPDVLPAARMLAGAGIRLACLTNGSAEVTAAFVRRTGLDPFIERVISVAEAGTWKPPATVYRHAASVLNIEPGRLALVAAHAWDCHGASRAGLVTGWVSRLEREYSPIFAPPDVTGADLTEVAGRLLDLPRR